MAPQEPIIHDPPFPGSIHLQYAYRMLSPISYLNQALIPNIRDPPLHDRSCAGTELATYNISDWGIGNPQDCTRESIINLMNATVTHDRTEETIESKALWFRSLTLVERMDMLCAFTELLLMANPKIVEQRNAQPIEGRILVLTAA